MSAEIRYRNAMAWLDSLNPSNVDHRALVRCYWPVDRGQGGGVYQDGQIPPGRYFEVRGTAGIVLGRQDLLPYKTLAPSESEIRRIYNLGLIDGEPISWQVVDITDGTLPREA